MTDKVWAAVIAGVVSVLVALLSAAITFQVAAQDRDEEYYSNTRGDILRARIEAYPALFESIFELSIYRKHYDTSELSREEAVEIGKFVNTWLYGSGGLFASAVTRGYAAGFRKELLEWESHKTSFQKARDQMIPLVLALRADLNLCGDIPDDRNLEPLLDRLIHDATIDCAKTLRKDEE